MTWPGPAGAENCRPDIPGAAPYMGMTSSTKMFTTEDLIAALREAVAAGDDRYVSVVDANEPDPDSRFVGGVRGVREYKGKAPYIVAPCLFLVEDWEMTASELLKALEAAPAVPGRERTEYPTDVYLPGDRSVGIFDFWATVIGTAMGNSGLEILVEP